MAGFSSSGFYPTKRGNPCPICSNTSGDCRETDSDLVLCHSYIDAGSAPTGWKWIDQTTNQLWGKFFPSNNDNDNSGWQIRQEENNRNRQQNQANRQKKYADGLTIQERDTNARKLLRQCPLLPADRDNLLARGIPAQQHEYFGSIYRGKVVVGINEKFPGIFTLRAGGQSIRLGKDINAGILCPAFSPDGLIIGFQVRASHEVEGGGKYRWLKSNYSSHLQNGELGTINLNPY